MNKLLLTIGLALALPASAAFGQDDPLPEGFETEPVLRSTTNRDGDPIEWPSGAPELVSVIGTIEAGGRTPLHQHPVPVFVYVLEGEVELTTEGGDPQIYRTGEAWLESIDKNHQLFNAGEKKARILAIFVGEEGTPPTVAAQ